MMISRIRNNAITIENFSNFYSKNIPTCCIISGSSAIMNVNSINAIFSNLNYSFIAFYLTNKHLKESSFLLAHQNNYPNILSKYAQSQLSLFVLLLHNIFRVFHRLLVRYNNSHIVHLSSLLPHNHPLQCFAKRKQMFQFFYDSLLLFNRRNRN